MISTPFEFVAPRHVDDVVELLATGDGTKLLAGGMSMVPAMNLGILRPDRIVSLNHVDGLSRVVDQGGAIRIGATTLHRDIASNSAIRRSIPFLAEAAAQIGDVQVRNRGTIGGSLAHADAAANYLPVLLVAGAEIVARSVNGDRCIPIDEFLRGVFSTSLEPNEMIVEILVPKHAEQDRSGYMQFVRVKGGLPVITAAATIDGRSARLAIGGALPTPFLVPIPDIAEDGTPPSLDEIARTARDLCADALADANAPAEYRQALAGVFARRTLERLWGDEGD